VPGGHQLERDRGVGGVRDIELRPLGEDVDGEQGRFGVVLDEEDPPALLPGWLRSCA
jgi:hypothetical protein